MSLFKKQDSNGPIAAVLSEGELACQFCGQAVPKVDQREMVRVETMGRVPRNELERQHVDLMVSRGMSSGFSVEMSTCPACRVIVGRAEALLEEYPGSLARRTWPQKRYATLFIANALLACDSIGRTPEIGNLFELNALLEQLSEVGTMASYRATIAPFMGPGVTRENAEKHAAGGRWSHLRSKYRLELVGELHRGFNEWMISKDPHPLVKRHPEGSGCFVCGVDRVEVLPKYRGNAWHEVQVRPSQVGGVGNEPVTCFVCWECWNAYQRQENPSWSWSLVSERHFEALGTANLVELEVIEPLDIRAWGTTSHAPTLEPFGWTNLEEVREQIRTQTGYRVGKSGLRRVR
ncbi:MAG: hypothetical protein WAS54_06070 [Scrofimicrobium sp.]